MLIYSYLWLLLILREASLSIIVQSNLTELILKGSTSILSYLIQWSEGFKIIYTRVIDNHNTAIISIMTLCLIVRWSLISSALLPIKLHMFFISWVSRSLPYELLVITIRTENITLGLEMLSFSLKWQLICL